MSLLNWTRSTARFNYVRRLIVIVLSAVLAIHFVTTLRMSQALAFSTTYASLINLVLTVTLVAITAFYAWVTNHMATELIESRRASIRPLLAISIANPTFGPERDSWRDMTFAITLSNVGRGTAVKTTMHGSAEHDSGTERKGIKGAVNKPPPPMLFAPGATYQGTLFLPLEIFEVKSRQNFVEIDVAYEDAEGNVYQLLALFDLQVFSSYGSSREYLVPNREALFFLPFHRRSALREANAIQDRRPYIRLYERWM